MILKVTGVNKHFNGVKAISDLSFEVQEGGITALIGPNGAGKTTLFDIITGFLRPDSGEVKFNEKDITHLPPHRISMQGISRTFQTIRLFPQMTVLDNIMLGMKCNRWETMLAALTRSRHMLREEAGNRERALELLDMVGLRHKQGHNADTLSYGQRRLVEIVRTLAMDAELYLFDEPTSGVYPEMIPKLLEVMRTLNGKGKTVLFIEHNMQAVRDVAQKVVVLNYGKKLAEGTPGEVLNNTVVHEAYFGRRGKVAS